MDVLCHETGFIDVLNAVILLPLSVETALGKHGGAAGVWVTAAFDRLARVGLLVQRVHWYGGGGLVRCAAAGLDVPVAGIVIEPIALRMF